MNDEFSDYGLWPLVVINSLVFILFAFSFARPRTPRDWRSFGAFSAFLVALFTEMYGFPLTIYLLSGWLSSRFPDVDWLAHDSGHLLEMMFGSKVYPHFGPFHLLSAIFIFGGFALLASAWRVLYRAQRGRTVAMGGPYSLVRHPQYAAFISIMFGFLLQWPTLLTVLMFPILVFMYVRLAKREEGEALAGFGEEYGRYRDRTPAFFPRFGSRLGLGAAILFILALLAGITFVSAPEQNFPEDAPPSGQRADRVQSNTLMTADLNRRRVQVDALTGQMQRGTGTDDPALRRELIRAHLDELRRISETPIHLKTIVAETDIGGVRAADASMNGTTIQR